MTRLTYHLRHYFGRSLERHLFVLAGVLFSVGIVAGTAIHLERDRKAAYKDRSERGALLADAFEVQVAHALSSVNGALDVLASRLERPGAPQGNWSIDELIRATGHVRSIWLLDGSHRVIASSDPEQIGRHVDLAQLGLTGTSQDRLEPGRPQYLHGAGPGAAYAIPFARSLGRQSYSLVAMVDSTALLPKSLEDQGYFMLLSGRDRRVIGVTSQAGIELDTTYVPQAGAGGVPIVHIRTARAAPLLLVTAVPAPVEPDFRAPDAPKMKWIGMAVAAFLLAYAFLLRGVMRHRETIEVELEHARDAAEEANAARGAFLSTVSHEIRTPLNAVIGMAALLRDTPLDAGQEDCAKTIEDSANALLAIVDDVLDFSKIDAGKLDIESVECFLLALVEGSVDILAGKARQKNLRLMSFVDPALPHIVLGDPVRLRQILLNLVGNAVKFTPAGEVLLSVRLLARKGGICTLRFEVADTGIGIDPAIVSTLFTPFSQADGSVTREYGGTGLGLSISKHLVELMGGQIVVESAPGSGSVFRFDLALPETGTALRESNANRLTGVHVVLVDPIRRQTEILRSYLIAAGAQVSHAATAAEALGLGWRGNGGRVVVVAAELPDMAPGAFTSELLARAPHARLVLLASNEDMRDDAGVMGYRHVLLQPVKHAPLLDAIAMALDESSSDHESSAIHSHDVPHPPGMVMPEAGPAILLVEDNIMNQKVAIRQLGLLGYVADIASNGQEALDALATFPYALVLMDCQMPLMDGYEATRRIRAREQKAGGHVHIVAMTANAMRGDRERCIKAGMDDYLSKPILPQHLAEMLARYLPHAPTAVLPVLDDQRLRAMCGNDEDFRRDMLDLFVSTTAPLLEKLRHAIESADWNWIGSLAHRMAGSAGNLGIEEFADLSRSMERACRAGDLNHLRRLHEETMAAFGRLCELVRKEKIS